MAAHHALGLMVVDLRPISACTADVHVGRHIVPGSR